MINFIPSKYQKEIFNWVKRGAGNLVVEARAGSGKTTTAVKSLQYLSASRTPVYLAFNNHIALELRSRLPAGHEARTYHSLGLAILRRALGDVTIDQDKLDKFLSGYVDKKTQKHLYYPVKKIVSILKGSLITPTFDNIVDLALYHDIDLNTNKEIIVGLSIEAMKWSKENIEIIDFDDMCWLPLVLDLPAGEFDLVIVDELQDTNRSQIELALRCTSGRVLGVGDRYQSIYGWRGADVDAIPRLIQRLQATTLPLPITYRNPISIVELVNEKFPHILFEARENAPMGEVAEIEYQLAIDRMQAKDMVLCRTNAPLVDVFFSLISKGIKATIRGRDIGKSLQALVRKINPPRNDNVFVFTRIIREYEDLEVNRLMIAGKESQAAIVRDKVETLLALSSGASAVSGLIARLDTVFADDIEGVVLSSIHRAKGLEAPRVFLLRPDLLPHPLARQDWQKEQEKNIEYVAYTRALGSLFIVK